MSNALVERKNSFKEFLTKGKDQIAMALPKHITPDRMLRVVLTSVVKNPKILECTNASIFSAVLQSAQLGVMPDGVLGEAYLIPRKNKGVMHCNFQIGYKGLVNLAKRAVPGTVVRVNPVYKGDVWEWNMIDGPIKHEKTTESGTVDSDITHFYAIIKYPHGGSDFAVMTNDQMDRHMKKYSQNWKYDSSIWQTDYPAMGKKTVLIQALKYAQLSPEINHAVGLDGQSERGEAQNNTVFAAENFHFDDVEMKEEIEDVAHTEIEEAQESAKQEKTEQAKKRNSNKANAAIDALKK